MKLAFLIVAVVLLALAAIWEPPRGNLQSAGLAFFVASFLVA